MVRETRHLLVGNLPDDVGKEEVVDYFKRYGRVEKVKILVKRSSNTSSSSGGSTENLGKSAYVDFVDIKSATKAHQAYNKIEDRELKTSYHEPERTSTTIVQIHEGGRGEDCDSSPPAGGTNARFSSRGYPDGWQSLSLSYDGRQAPSGTSATSYDYGSRSIYKRHYDDRSSGGYPTQTVLEDYTAVTPTAAASSTAAASAMYYQNAPEHASRSRRNYRRHPVQNPKQPQRGDNYAKPFAQDLQGAGKLYNAKPGRSHKGSRPTARKDKPTTGRDGDCKPQPNVVTAGGTAAERPRSAGSPSRSRSASADSRSSSNSSGSSISSVGMSTVEGSKLKTSKSPSLRSLSHSIRSDSPEQKIAGTGICVKNLPTRSTDTSLKDGLFHEFKKHGMITAVRVQGEPGKDRFGVVFFKRQEDATKAVDASQNKLFFGCKMEVSSYSGPMEEMEGDYKFKEDPIDEYHPKASRTLFIGNLEGSTGYSDLKELFNQYGEIVDIDIKKQGGVPVYAFMQFFTITSVVSVIKKMDGATLGKNKLKLGFGKSMPSNCLWAAGISSSVTESYLARFFGRHSHVTHVIIDREKKLALLYFASNEMAQRAMMETKGRLLSGKKLQVDFSSQECQAAFYQSMDSTGQIYKRLSRPPSPSPPPEPIYEQYRGTREEMEYEYAAAVHYAEGRRSRGAYHSYHRGHGPPEEMYYQDYYPPTDHEWARGAHYEDEYGNRVAPPGMDGDTYEQELREYGYRQKERKDVVYRNRSPSPRDRYTGRYYRSSSMEGDHVNHIMGTKYVRSSITPPPQAKEKASLKKLKQQPTSRESSSSRKRPRTSISPSRSGSNSRPTSPSTELANRKMAAPNQKKSRKPKIPPAKEPEAAKGWAKVKTEQSEVGGELPAPGESNRASKRIVVCKDKRTVVNKASNNATSSSRTAVKDRGPAPKDNNASGSKASKENESAGGSRTTTTISKESGGRNAAAKESSSSSKKNAATSSSTGKGTAASSTVKADSGVGSRSGAAVKDSSSSGGGAKKEHETQSSKDSGRKVKLANEDGNKSGRSRSQAKPSEKSSSAATNLLAGRHRSSSSNRSRNRSNSHSSRSGGGREDPADASSREKNRLQSTAVGSQASKKQEDLPPRSRSHLKEERPRDSSHRDSSHRDANASESRREKENKKEATSRNDRKDPGVSDEVKSKKRKLESDDKERKPKQSRGTTAETAATSEARGEKKAVAAIPVDDAKDKLKDKNKRSSLSNEKNHGNRSVSKSKPANQTKPLPVDAPRDREGTDSSGTAAATEKQQNSSISSSLSYRKQMENARQERQQQQLKDTSSATATTTTTKGDSAGAAKAASPATGSVDDGYSQAVARLKETTLAGSTERTANTAEKPSAIASAHSSSGSTSGGSSKREEKAEFPPKKHKKVEGEVPAGAADGKRIYRNQQSSQDVENAWRSLKDYEEGELSEEDSGEDNSGAAKAAATASTPKAAAATATHKQSGAAAKHGGPSSQLQASPHHQQVKGHDPAHHRPEASRGHHRPGSHATSPRRPGDPKAMMPDYLREKRRPKSKALDTTTREQFSKRTSVLDTYTRKTTDEKPPSTLEEFRKSMGVLPGSGSALQDLYSRRRSTSSSPATATTTELDSEKRHELKQQQQQQQQQPLQPQPYSSHYSSGGAASSLTVGGLLSGWMSGTSKPIMDRKQMSTIGKIKKKSKSLEVESTTVGTAVAVAAAAAAPSSSDASQAHPSDADDEPGGESGGLAASGEPGKVRFLRSSIFDQDMQRLAMSTLSEPLAPGQLSSTAMTLKTELDLSNRLLGDVLKMPTRSVGGDQPHASDKPAAVPKRVEAQPLKPAAASAIGSTAAAIPNKKLSVGWDRSLPGSLQGVRRSPKPSPPATPSTPSTPSTPTQMRREGPSCSPAQLEVSSGSRGGRMPQAGSSPSGFRRASNHEFCYSPNSGRRSSNSEAPHSSSDSSLTSGGYASSRKPPPPLPHGNSRAFQSPESSPSPTTSGQFKALATGGSGTSAGGDRRTFQGGSVPRLLSSQSDSTRSVAGTAERSLTSVANSAAKPSAASDVSSTGSGKKMAPEGAAGSRSADTSTTTSNPQSNSPVKSIPSDQHRDKDIKASLETVAAATVASLKSLSKTLTSTRVAAMTQVQQQPLSTVAAPLVVAQQPEVKVKPAPAPPAESASMAATSALPPAEPVIGEKAKQHEQQPAPEHPERESKGITTEVKHEISPVATVAAASDSPSSHSFPKSQSKLADGKSERKLEAKTERIAEVKSEKRAVTQLQPERKPEEKVVEKKQEAKSERKSEIKSERKPEAKAEKKSEEKVSDKPSSSSTTALTSKSKNLKGKPEKAKEGEKRALGDRVKTLSESKLKGDQHQLHAGKNKKEAKKLDHSTKETKKSSDHGKDNKKSTSSGDSGRKLAADGKDGKKSAAEISTKESMKKGSSTDSKKALSEPSREHSFKKSAASGSSSKETTAKKSADFGKESRRSSDGKDLKKSTDLVKESTVGGSKQKKKLAENEQAAELNVVDRKSHSYYSDSDEAVPGTGTGSGAGRAKLSSSSSSLLPLLSDSDSDDEDSLKEMSVRDQKTAISSKRMSMLRFLSDSESEDDTELAGSSVDMLEPIPTTAGKQTTAATAAKGSLETKKKQKKKAEKSAADHEKKVASSKKDKKTTHGTAEAQAQVVVEKKKESVELKAAAAAASKEEKQPKKKHKQAATPQKGKKRKLFAVLSDSESDTEIPAPLAPVVEKEVKLAGSSSKSKKIDKSQEKAKELKDKHQEKVKESKPATKKSKKAKLEDTSREVAAEPKDSAAGRTGTSVGAKKEPVAAALPLGEMKVSLNIEELNLSKLTSDNSNISSVLDDVAEQLEPPPPPVKKEKKGNKKRDKPKKENSEKSVVAEAATELPQPTSMESEKVFDIMEKHLEETSFLDKSESRPERSLEEQLKVEDSVSDAVEAVIREAAQLQGQEKKKVGGRSRAKGRQLKSLRGKGVENKQSPSKPEENRANAPVATIAEAEEVGEAASATAESLPPPPGPDAVPAPPPGPDAVPAPPPAGDDIYEFEESDPTKLIIAEDDRTAAASIEDRYDDESAIAAAEISALMSDNKEASLAPTEFQPPPPPPLADTAVELLLPEEKLGAIMEETAPVDSALEELGQQQQQQRQEETPPPPPPPPPTPPLIDEDKPSSTVIKGKVVAPVVDESKETVAQPEVLEPKPAAPPAVVKTKEEVGQGKQELPAATVSEVKEPLPLLTMEEKPPVKQQKFKRTRKPRQVKSPVSKAETPMSQTSAEPGPASVYDFTDSPQAADEPPQDTAAAMATLAPAATSWRSKATFAEKAATPEVVVTASNVIPDQSVVRKALLAADQPLAPLPLPPLAALLPEQPKAEKEPCPAPVLVAAAPTPATQQPLPPTSLQQLPLQAQLPPVSMTAAAQLQPPAAAIPPGSAAPALMAAATSQPVIFSQQPPVPTLINPGLTFTMSSNMTQQPQSGGMVLASPPNLQLSVAPQLRFRFETTATAASLGPRPHPARPLTSQELLQQQQQQQQAHLDSRVLFAPALAQQVPAPPQTVSLSQPLSSPQSEMVARAGGKAPPSLAGLQPPLAVHMGIPQVVTRQPTQYLAQPKQKVSPATSSVEKPASAGRLLAAAAAAAVLAPRDQQVADQQKSSPLENMMQLSLGNPAAAAAVQQQLLQQQQQQQHQQLQQLQHQQQQQQQQQQQRPPPPPRQDNMLSIMQRHPVVWQGHLALKNEFTVVQMHYVAGNLQMAHLSLPPVGTATPLRIAQRMRLESSQLDGVAHHMQVDTSYCLLLALPCGRDQEDVVVQTQNLQSRFITYLQQKQAAGIVNVPQPGSNNATFTLHIFPPCPFTQDTLSRLAPLLLDSVQDIAHMMIVIAANSVST